VTGAAWVLATRSAGKVRELEPWFAARGIAVVGLDAVGLAWSEAEESIEGFDTFEENAVAKARWYAARTGRPCVADDSGLVVDALDGAPGVRSRRFAADLGMAGVAGTEDARNNAALLERLSAVGAPHPWIARYVCVAALVDGDATWTARGECSGRIVAAPRGAGGFGYDPFFCSDELGSTFAEASLEAKSAVSHRGRAFAALLATVASGDPPR
jgi:XTP/dITP diphosphohydrolase